MAICYYLSESPALKAARRDPDEDPEETKNKVLQEGKLFWLLKHQVCPFSIFSGLLGVCLEQPNLSVVMEYVCVGALNIFHLALSLYGPVSIFEVSV